jgi:hypothetical protein
MCRNQRDLHLVERDASQEQLRQGERSRPGIVQPVIVRGVNVASEGKPFSCHDCGEQQLWVYLVGLMGLQMICADCMTRWFEVVNA